MFSKLTLIMTISLMLTSNAFAQSTKKADSKKATDAKALEAKKAEEARALADKKAAEEKAAQEQREAEAKLASEKAKAEDQSGVFGYLKSHFNASYHGEYYFVRKDALSADENDRDLQDLKIMHNPTIIYRPFKNWNILATSEFKYTDASAATRGSYINRHYRSLILINRENILTEKENGIKMDAAIGRRIFDRNHGAAGSYGNNRINTSLSKKFGDKLSSSLLVQYLGNDPVKAKITPNTWRHSLELIPSFTFQITDKLSYFFNDDFILNTPWQKDNAKDFDFSHEMNIGVVSYQFNDKNSAYFQFKYLHTSDAPFQAAPAVTDWFEYYIGETHSFTPKLSLTAEVGSKIFAAHDQRSFFAKEIAYPEFALYLDWAL
ncbi:MAG: hypothetical protein H7177_06095 [Rhizobacter sp.]|nr:hypothetical protein [Bacteriovorax sp.]